MGKIRTRTLGDESVEEKQKKLQKERSKEKKAYKYKKSEEAQQKDVMGKIGVEVDSYEGVSGVGSELEKSISDSGQKDKKFQKKLSRKKKVNGKKYKESAKKVQKDKLYSLDEAINLVKEVKFANFDESVELHLNVEKKGLKGEISLPHSVGKNFRVAIVDDALIDRLENGFIEFDILICSPSYMPKLAKFARILGPKGLMPSPKVGTVSTEPEKVAEKFSKGAIRWKTEPKFPIIHQIVGKCSFDNNMLSENIVAFIKEVGISEINSVFISSSMGPSVKIDISTVR